ncbi:MAG: hypothetical protein HY726_00735 [Candidatus Rokubacteria bacterium]|nr:hypothetical protein [Candidatus Rokubacteria bacterium]
MLSPVLRSPADAGLTEQVGATFALMVEDFFKAFPAVEGLVVAVEGDRLYMDLAGKDGIQEGQELTVFRKGEVFRHPLTHQPLGRYEERLGHAHVLRIFPAYSEARYIPLNGKPRARPEDGVRITRGRIRVAVAPALDLTESGADLRRVPYLLAVALERTKRFEAVDPQRVVDLFATEGAQVEVLLVGPDKAARLGRALEVAGWLVPVLLVRGGVTYLDVTWISAVTGHALFSKRRTLARPEPTEEQRFPWEPRAVD